MNGLYAGRVMHHRLRPRMHRFRYRAFWLLVDLDDLPRLGRSLRWLSYNRPNLFSLQDRDHGDGSAAPLRAQIERRLSDAGVDIAGGRISLFCMPRTLGFGFNPLSIYFCHGADGALAAIVYQVHNTFGGRRSYVIAVRSGDGLLRHSCGKLLYVSPFMDMNMRYEFRISTPADTVGVAIRVVSHDGPIMNAVLTGSRMELSDRNLLAMAVRIPAVTMKVMVAIHWEALRLWLKGFRVFSPPPGPPDVAATAVRSRRMT